MFTGRTTYRIIYGDTDQMGVVYYGNYGRFYEMGRSELIRDLGYTYKSLEDSGIFMPVAAVKSKYHLPLKYDELITIETSVKEVPQVRMVFYHTIYNSEMKKAHSAEVTLVFLNAETNRPTRAPENLLKFVEKVMENNE